MNELFLESVDIYRSINDLQVLPPNIAVYMQWLQSSAAIASMVQPVASDRTQYNSF